DGKTLAVACEPADRAKKGRVIHLRDAETGAVTASLDGPPAGAGIAFDGAFARLAIADGNGALVLRKFPSGEVLRRWQPQADFAPQRALFTARDSRLLVAASSGRVRLVDIAGGATLVAGQIPAKLITLALSPDERWLAVSGADQG